MKTNHTHDGLFQYYCVAHRVRTPDRSPVTIYQGCWAYCAHGYGGGHDWRPIEPINDVNLRSFGPTFLTPRPEPTPAAQPSHNVLRGLRRPAASR